MVYVDANIAVQGGWIHPTVRAWVRVPFILVCAASVVTAPIQYEGACIISPHR